MITAAEEIKEMDDLISRQLVISAIMSEPADAHYSSWYADIVRNLPSSETVIRCKDCKYRDPEDKKCDCGHDILWQLPRQNDWFCADGERR